MIANYKVCPNCGNFCIDPNNNNNYGFKCLGNVNLDIDQSYDRYLEEMLFECKSCKHITNMNGMPRYGEYFNLKRTKLIDKMLNEQ